MQQEVKMYMLVSGMPVITYEERNERGEVLWEFPMMVVLTPPQRPGTRPGIHLNPLNQPPVTKSNRAMPNMNLILYPTLPNEEVVQGYIKTVDEIKAQLSGIITLTKKLIV